jgi:hypothetical protein
VTRVAWGLTVACAMGLVFAAGAPKIARSEPEKRFDLEVTVASISDEKGDIDPKGKRLDKELRKKFRYNSLRVLQTQHFNLKIDEIGSMTLPDGKVFKVRPMNLGDRGLLMAVEWSDTVMMDMNAMSGHLLVVGGSKYQGRELVVGVEPHYER